MVELAVTPKKRPWPPMHDLALILISAGLSCLLTASAFYRAGRQDALREVEQWRKRRRV